MLALTPKVQPDKLIQVDLKLSFTETVTMPRSGKSKPHDFHLPVHAVVTARAGDTLLVPTVENDKTMMRLLFATVTILAPNKE
jgi:hypothetical protein